MPKLKHLNSLIALMVLAVVFCGLLHEGCRHAIYADTVSGLLVGAMHGVLHTYCIYEQSKSGRSISARRVKRIMMHDLRMDAVIGLLVGVVNALAQLFRH